MEIILRAYISELKYTIKHKGKNYVAATHPLGEMVFNFKS
jgi:hypothetical protein